MEGDINVNINKPAGSSGGSDNRMPLKKINLGERLAERFSSESSGENRPESKKESGFIVKMLDKIITVSLFSIFFGLPLFFTGVTFQGIAFDKQMYFFFWVLLSLVAWASKSVITGEMKIRRTALDIPIVSFWLIYLAATFFSIDRWHSFMGFFGDPSRGFMNITALILIYYIIVSNFNKTRFFWMFSGLLMSGSLAVVLAALAILGIRILPDSLAQYTPLSLMGSVASLSILAGAIIPLLLTAIFKIGERNDLKSWLKMSLTVLILLVMAIDLMLILSVFSFFPWVGMLIGIVIFLVYILSKIIRPIETWVWLPMVVFVILMIFLIIGQVQISRINLPVEVGMRGNFSWDITQKSLKDNFFLGTGPATYGYDFSRYKNESFNLNSLYNLRFYQSSGLFFESLPTIGALGSIALAVLLLTFLGVNGFLLSKEKEKNKIYSLGVMSSAMIIIASIIVNNAEAPVLILAALVAALTTAVLIMESETKEEFLSFSLKASPKFALALAFIFLVVSAGVAFLFVFIGRTFVADVYAGMAARVEANNHQGMIVKLQKAVNLNPKESRYMTAVGQRYMVMANEEILKGENERDINAIRDYLNFSVLYTRQARDIMKKDVLANESLAQIYENAGLYIPESVVLAEETYRQASELDPNNPNYFLKLGQIKVSLAAGKKEPEEKKTLITEAKDLFQISVDKKKNFAPGFYYLSLAEEALGNIDLAIDNMQQAVNFQSNNVDYIFNLARMFQSRGKGDDLKTAEALFKKILGVNDKDINTHFNLGLLYEKDKENNRKADAVTEYKKVLELLPDSENTQKTKEQLNKMIENISNGIENTPESLGLSTAAATGQGNQTQPAPPAQ